MNISEKSKHVDEFAEVPGKFDCWSDLLKIFKKTANAKMIIL